MPPSCRAVGASLLPAAALGLGLSLWWAGARRTVRDVLAALLVGTLVTEAAFGLPGIGSVVNAVLRRNPTR